MDYQSSSSSPNNNYYATGYNNNSPNATTTPPTDAYIAIPNARNRRGSIFDNLIGSFRGVNSLSRFASSYHRSLNFQGNKLTENDVNQGRSYFNDDGEELVDPSSLVPTRFGSRLSTVLKNLPNMISFDDFPEGSAVDDDTSIYSPSIATQQRTESSFSYGNNLRPINSRSSLLSSVIGVGDTSFLKAIETTSGNKTTVIAGESTLPQTIFNSINILIGIGLLALPLGLRYAGWVIGVPFLTLCALSTFLTAELLSKCMDTDPTLMTYADIGFAAYGTKARVTISILFTLDLLGAGVSLIILFSDTLNVLFPQISSLQFKLVSFLVLTPFTFLPLRILSIFSLLGICCTISVIITVFLLGLYKQTTPGSLIEFAPSNLYPISVSSLLIAIGIIISPFGGHSIFPNLRVDMRHPHRFSENLKVTYSVTYLADCSMACIGFLMFGFDIKNIVIKNVLGTEGYPPFVYVLISCFISMVPLLKTPLNALPIVSMLDLISGVPFGKELSFAQKLIRNWNRVFVNIMFVVVAIFIPEFDRILGIMGASVCFTVCIIFPCLFYMKLCQTTRFERVCCWIAISVSVVLGVSGTYASVFLSV